MRGAGLSLGALLLGALVLGGCTRATAIGCSADSAQAPVIDIVKEQLERLVAKDARSDGSAHLASLSKIRASVAQLVIGLDDIRTSKTDPNSTKRFCTGALRIRFPQDTLNDADQARQATGLKDVTALADDADVERQADSFTSTVEFNVQPTDDGSKIFAQLENGDAMLNFAKEVLVSALARAQVQETQRAQQAAADQENAAKTTAQAQQRDATLNAARTDNQLATQTIAATWKAIPGETRDRLLPVQRAWIRKKDADCAVEAASASLDPSERETARLGCDTRETQERIGFLNGYRGGQGEAPTIDSVMANY